MTAFLARIFRHPIKSIGSEELSEVTLVADAPMPGDRAFAIIHGTSEWRDDAAGWMNCRNFMRIANAPALAAVTVHFDAKSMQIELEHPERSALAVDLATPEGRAALAEWIAPLSGPVKPPFRVVDAAKTVFTDSDAQMPSIMSLASLRDLEAKMGTPLDLRRFRGNLWIDGVEPWAELDWEGREISIGDARFRITEPIPRCRATMANPSTGERDADPMQGLIDHYEHKLFGVEARVIVGGTIAKNSVLKRLNG